MANPTPVNGQTIDSVTQANVEVLGVAPAQGVGTIYQSLGHATSTLFQSAVGAQQQLAVAGQAATNEGVMQIYSVNTMAGVVATSKIAQSDEAGGIIAHTAAEQVNEV